MPDAPTPTPATAPRPETRPDEANRPVAIGLAQLIRREPDPATAPSPLDMLEEIARACAADAGPAQAVIEAIDAIGLVDVAAWHPQNGPRLLAERLGIQPKSEIVTRVGGELSLVLVNTLAERILAGETSVALVAGANNLDSLRKVMKTGTRPDWPRGGDGEPEELGSEWPGTSAREEAHGIKQPTTVYPILENALRARRGRTFDEHTAALGALMAPFTRVAASNPYAWFPVERSAEELTTVTDENRMISFPYPKYLNAVIATDQAAGVILCSQATAEALGVPREKWLYWWGGANTWEKAWFVSERPAIGESPALRECARRTLANAHVDIDDVQHVDLYSCFPLAVELGCEAYGIGEDDPRGLTVTGGLPYAGGPANNYSTHSLVAMLERLRAHPGEKGLVTGNGWYVTKHSANVWSTAPSPATPTSLWDESPAVGDPPVEMVEAPRGEAVIDSYTITYDREGRPERGFVLGHLVSDGRRFVANTASDATVLAELEGREPIGRGGHVEPVDGLNVFTLD